MINQNLDQAFSVGDFIVYPKYGVGQIERIDMMTFQEEAPFQAFSILLKATGMRVSIPLDKVQMLGLRAIYPEKTIGEVFDILRSDHDPEDLKTAKTWKERKKILDDLFASGQLEDLAYIIKFLYEKNQQKTLPNSERRIYDFALKFLVHEVSKIKSLSEEEAEHLIAEHLISRYS